ncbi:MAG: sulfurtransferase TusA family protein [Nocardioidaceae bacterium]
MTDVVDPVIELDCRGQRCPRPILELARALPTVPTGSVLAVVADDPAARNDVAAWCRMRQQDYVGEDTAPDGTPRFLVRRVG